MRKRCWFGGFMFFLKKINHYFYFFFMIFCLFPGHTSARTTSDTTDNLIDVRTPLFQTLVKDMFEYKTSSKRCHAGNLFQHSVWVEQTLAEFIESQNSSGPKSFWCSDIELTKREKQIVALAAFLHDIGKAGDHVFIFPDKPKHKAVGAQYILGNSAYRLKNGMLFDFDALFKEIKVTTQEKLLIAILINFTHAFGEWVMNNCGANVKHNAPVFKKYITDIQNFAVAIKYPQAIDEKLIKMAILVTAADAKGVQPAAGTSTILFPSPQKISPVRKTTGSLYDKFDYEEKGKVVRAQLLEYFRQNKELFLGLRPGLSGTVVPHPT